jgi:hypothetical protein
LALKKKAIFLVKPEKRRHIINILKLELSNEQYLCWNRERSNGSFDSHIFKKKMHDFYVDIFKDIEGDCILRPIIRSFQITG